jgi:hypothetical protein
VDVAYVRRLIDLGVVGPEAEGYREQDAHVTALLHIWERIGPAELQGVATPVTLYRASPRRQ